MSSEDPVLSTVMSMTEAFNRGRLDVILSHYEPGAVVVGEPGRPLRGEAALREMFEGFLAVQPVFTYAGHEVLRCGDLALHLAPWEMTGAGPNGEEVRLRGLSVAVLRRQTDETWRLVIDQPFGDALLANAPGTAEN